LKLVIGSARFSTVCSSKQSCLSYTSIYEDICNPHYHSRQNTQTAADRYINEMKM
jgi:hypothetical protein